MAQRITWSRRAQSDRYSIFDYWNSRKKSKSYSRKLNGLFVDAIEFVAKHPHTGKITDRANIRIKFISHFALIYRFEKEELYVLTIFDTRQNPGKMNKILQNE